MRRRIPVNGSRGEIRPADASGQMPGGGIGRQMPTDDARREMPPGEARGQVPPGAGGGQVAPGAGPGGAGRFAPPGGRGEGGGHGRRGRRPIPPKLYRMGEVVDYSGMSRQTIHNYTTMGLLPETMWTSGGHRLYDESVFERLDQIAELKARHKSMADIREHFAMLDRRQGPAGGRGQSD